MTKQENEERLARLKNIVLSMPESQEATNITTKSYDYICGKGEKSEEKSIFLLP